MRRLIAGILGALIGLGAAAPLLGAAKKADKPVEAVAMKDCVTSECHAGVKEYKYLHGPVNVNSCDSCHHLADAKEHCFEIKRQKAELCTFCHEFSVGKLPVVHKPVMNGECLGCHNPHGGPGVSLMREKNTAELCGRCHESVSLGRKFQHKPVADAACETCHAPHASKFPKMLDAVGQDLCLHCHKEFGQQMADVKVTHKAMEKGCLQCHDPHASNQPKAVVAPMADLCLSCHDKIKADATQAAYRHPAVLGERACMTCHTAHGGDLAKLMADQPVKICMSCHKEPIKGESGKMIAGVPEIADQHFFKHGPIRDGQCGGCHTTHGGDTPLLLRKANVRSFYEEFSKDSYALCFSCHKPELAERQLADGNTQFHNGNVNLHHVHVTKGRGRNCNVCHASHAGKHEQSIRDHVTFGKWELPITFRKTETGGSCTTGCHRDYAYDRVNPVAGPTQGKEYVGDRIPAADPKQAVLAKWSGKDVAGKAVVVPDAAKPTLLLFLRPEQPQSQQVVKMTEAALREGHGAQVIVILSGSAAAEQASALAAQKVVAWPIVTDADGKLAQQHGVASWPATLIVRPDATVVSHIAGAPLSLTFAIGAYIDFASGKIERDALHEQLARHALVSDGPVQKAVWHAQMGERLLIEGKAELAKQMFLDGLKLDATNVPLQAGLAEALIQLNDADAALKQLAKLPPNAIAPWQQNLLRGKALVALGRWNEAKVAAQAVLQERPETADAHYLMGRIYEQEKDWANAAKSYRMARER